MMVEGSKIRKIDFTHKKGQKKKKTIMIIKGERSYFFLIIITRNEINKSPFALGPFFYHNHVWSVAWVTMLKAPAGMLKLVVATNWCANLHYSPKNTKSLI